MAARTAAVTDVPTRSSLYTSSLWLDSASEAEDMELLAASPLRVPLKGMTAAAEDAAGSLERGEDGVPRLSPAHLIASRISSAQEHQMIVFPAGKKPDSAVAEGSPRITALHASTTSVPSYGEQGTGLAALGALLRRLSLQLPLGGGSSSGYVAFESPEALSPAHLPPADPAGAAAPAGVQAPLQVENVLNAPNLFELALGRSLDAGASTSTPTLPADAADARISPAHLIAPARLMLTPTPPPAQAAAAAAAAAPAVGDDGTILLGSLQQLALLPLPSLQERGQQPTLQHQQHPDQPGQEEAEDGPLSEASPLSSASSGRYSPEVAAGRFLDSSGGQATRGWVEGLPLTAAAAPSTSAGSGWQQAREGGNVRRSLAHPIYELQPDRVEGEEEDWQRLQQRAVAGLTALAASQRRASSPASPAAGWTANSSHFQIDLRPPHDGCPSPLSALSALSSLPAAGGVQHACAAQVAVAWPAQTWGRYSAVLRQLEDLNLSRVRRAVRSDLKRQRKAERRARPSLLSRLLKGCFHPAHQADDWPMPRQLRRELERQREFLLCLGRVPYNPDLPAHFELWQAVCSACAGLDGTAGVPLDPSMSAWEVLGFAAANPSPELGDTGLLGLLFLLLLAERSPMLAAHLVEAGAAGVPPAAAAVEGTTWTLRLLRTGALAAEARRLGSTCAAAELFFLGAMDCCLQELQDASEAVRRLPQPRRALAILALAEERACGTAAASVMRGAEVAEC